METQKTIKFKLGKLNKKKKDFIDLALINSLNAILKNEK
jgi:hypothetical protein